MDEEEFLIFMQKINKKVEIEEIFKRFLYFPASLLFLLNLIIIFASTPFKQTATEAHAVVNEIQLNSSNFSSFLNIVTDRDESLRTG